MIADKATGKIREVLRQMLNERFSDEFEFGPIVVIPRVDQDGEEYRACIRTSSSLGRPEET